MNYRISDRAKGLSPSLTLAIDSKAKAMKALKSRLLDLEREKQDAAVSAERKSMVSTGERSQKIRTYNYPQNRVTDHRINESFTLDQVMVGRLGLVVDAIEQFARSQRKSEMEQSSKSTAS